MLLTKRWIPAEAQVASQSTEAVPGRAPSEVAEKPLVKRKKTSHIDKADSLAPPVSASVASGESSSKVVRAAATDAQLQTPTPELYKKPQSRRSRRKNHQKNMFSKDPEVAATYLQAWSAANPPKQPKLREMAVTSSGKAWKFNKATQAWLLRHCYNSQKVSKNSFQILIRYLHGLQGSSRERAVAEAGAIVELRGAKLTAEAEEALPGASLATNGEAEDDAADADDAEADEEQSRRIRLRRAKKVLAALTKVSE